MKKWISIVLLISITLAICLTGCFNKQADQKKVDLGERYDSEKVVMFLPGGTYNDNYQNKLAEIYENYHKAASKIQFVVHENTAYSNRNCGGCDQRNISG